MKIPGLKILFLLVAIAAALSIPACSTTPKRSPATPAPPADAANLISETEKTDLALDDLLLLPLEGLPSAQRLSETLQRSFRMKPLRESQFSSEGPLQLSDGRRLSFAYIRKLSGSIDIGVDETPCVDPEKTARLIGAERDPVYQDAHGVDHGRVYVATRNGTRVRFNTTSVTYRCVTAIHISPAP